MSVRVRVRARARVRLRLTLSLTLPWALLQTPLTRFGDTAANSGVLLLLSSTRFGQAMPPRA